MGDSGGANLALGLAILAHRQGRTPLIDGVYASVPYISGRYGLTDAQLLDELPSMVENEGYMNSRHIYAVMAAVYDPGGSHADDPLCWPYRASVEDLKGLPPHSITVCQLDSLRDEGLAYFHKLREAGVPAGLRTFLGFGHGGDFGFRRDLPEDYAATITHIRDFITHY